MSDWCTIESDPGVFTELVQKMGVKGTQLAELVTLEPEEMERLGKIHGFIFLFKWRDDPEKPDTLSEYDPQLFFANQVINNACATQAILSVLMNCPDIEIGSELQQLRDFCTSAGLGPKDIGFSLGNSDVIRTAHNSFAKQEPISYTKEKAGDDDDVFHFISYVPFNNRLYELDGLQAGPIDHGECQPETWQAQAREAIQKRIEKYAASEIKFNLLAVIDDIQETKQKELDLLKGQQAHLLKQLGEEYDESVPPLSEDEISKLPTEADAQQMKLAELVMKMPEVEEELRVQTEQRKNWTEENQRRRHNYFGLIYRLLEVASEKGCLDDMYKAALEKEEQMRKEKQDAKAQPAQ